MRVFSYIADYRRRSTMQMLSVNLSDSDYANTIYACFI